MAKSCGVKSRSALYREIFAEPISVNGNATSGVEARKKGLRLFCRNPFSQLVLTAAEDMGYARGDFLKCDTGRVLSLNAFTRKQFDPNELCTIVPVSSGHGGMHLGQIRDRPLVSEAENTWFSAIPQRVARGRSRDNLRLRTPIANLRRRLRVCSVARYSTDEQRRQSIRAQHRHNRTAIESVFSGEIEWSEISDEGISGELRDRPGTHQLRTGIAEGLWDLIVCEDSSRLYRNPPACLELVGSAVDNGIRVICIGDDVDTAEEDWDDRLNEAQQHHCRDNKHTRRRIRRAFDDLWEAGATLGALKPGFKRRATNPDEEDRKKRGPYYDELDERWVPKIYEAYERIAGILKTDPHDGSAQMRVGEPPWSVARWLTNQGVPKLNGKIAPWTDKEVIVLIRSTIYRGEDIHGLTRSVRNFGLGGSTQRANAPEDMKRRSMPHLRITPDWLWQRANQAIDSRRRPGNPRSGRDNPLFGIPRDSRRQLSRLLHCFCGRKMYGEGRNEGGYRCSGARSGACWCKATALRSLTHQNIAQEIVQALLPEPALVDAFVTYCQHRLHDDAYWQSQEDQLCAHERSLRAKCQRLAARIEESDGESQTLVELLLQREREATEATAELEAWRHQRAVRPEVPSTESIRAAIESASRRLVDFDADVGVLLEQLIVGEIRTVPYQQFGTNKVVLRAEFELNLAAILPEQLVAVLFGASDWQPNQWLPIKRLQVDLFEPSLVPRHAMAAFRLSLEKVNGKDKTLCQIGQELGISKRRAYLAKELGKEMQAAGIQDPYIRLEHAPEGASRWRTNRPASDSADAESQPGIDRDREDDANAA